MSFKHIRLVALLLALAGLAGDLRAQNIVSVPFPNGVIGTRGSSAATANNVKTFATLGISRIFFIQSSSTNQFELQGNDIPGTMRIVRTSGATLDIPASVNWRATSSGTTYLIGLLPRPASPITLTYSGGSIQITDGSTTGGTSIGGYIAGYTGTTLADGGSTNGNAANGVLNDLNTYLATVVSSRPAGPVTVAALTTSSTTPTITGTASVAAGENLSVVVNGVQYTTSSTPAVTLSGTSWSLALTTPLALGTYSVTATITNGDGFTLSDATSNELTIGTSGGTVTVGGSFTANGRTYDGTTSATGTTSGLTLAGVQGSDNVTIASVTLAFQTAAVGTGKTVTITGVTLGGTNAAHYTVSLTGAPTATANVSAKALTITGVSAASRVYDGTTTATLSGAASYGGLAGGESFAVTGTPAATFATAAVGTGKAVTVTGYTAPTTNYTVAQPTGLTANVTAKALTIGGTFTASSKPYDGTAAATAATSGLTLVGVVGSETVSLTGVTAAFADASVGTGKAVTLTAAALTGADAGHYTLSLAGAPSTTASITSAGGTVTIAGSFSASDKVYDGTVAATGTTSGLTLAGVQGGDNVTIASVTLAFQSAAAAGNKTVVITGVTLGGTNGAQYAVSLAGAPTATAGVTARPLTIGGVGAASRTYDGTTAATLTGTASYAGLASGESFAVAGTPSASFATAAAGAGKSVTVTGYAAPSANYTVTQPTGLAATIAPKTLTVGGSFAAASKTYDGATTATITTGALTLVGVVGADVVSLTGVSAAFADAAVGAAKPVALGTAALAGAAAPNYTLSLAGAPTTTASITAAGGTVTIGGALAASSKVYDGTTAATGSAAGLTLVGVAGSHQATIASVTLAFQTAAVGTGKTVTLTGVTLGGADAGLYAVSLAGAPTAAASITPRPATVGGAFTASSKPFDGTVAATLATNALTVVGAAAGDALTLTGVSAAFADAAVGTGKPVALTAASLAGAAAPNYALSLAGAPTTTASITTAGGTVTVGGSFTANGRVYDGTTAATGTTAGLTLAGVTAPDQVAIASVTLGFQTAAAGSGKTVVITAVTLAGADAARYAVSLAGAPTATASVAPRPLTVGGSFAAASRLYDRTTAAAITTNALTLVGAVAGDAVSLGGLTAAFADPAVGAGKPVTLGAASLAGAAASNYALSTAGAPTTTASITPRPVSVGGSFVAADKVYDGNLSAVVVANALTLVGVLPGDALALTGLSARFADPAVGTAKPVALATAALAGAAAPNYVLGLVGAPTARASIAAATPPSAPPSVGGSSGDGALTVSWSIPQTPGCRAITGFAIEVSADAGQSWTRATVAPPTATSAVLTGLANNVPYRVRVAAINNCGQGDYSTVAGPFVPVGPTRDGTGTPAPVAPGAAGVTTGGVTQPVATEVVQDTIVRLAGDGFAMRVRATDRPGAAIPVDATRALQLERGGRVAADGSGFAAGTVVTGYLFAERGASLLLGTAPVGADGAFSATMPVPDTLPAGAYTLQVNGVDRTSRLRAVGIGVAVVLPPPDLTLAAAPSDSTPAAGDTITITITVTNRGSGPAADVVIPRAFHEPGFAVVRATPLEGSYDAATQAWTIRRIEPAARARMVLTVVVVPSAPTPPPASQVPQP